MPLEPEEDPSTHSEATFFRFCSTCRKSIAFSADYYRCSVSTCNRARTALYFCSVPCWDAHVPEARHRDAWAEKTRAPTREAFQAERESALPPTETSVEDKPVREHQLASNALPADTPREVLIVVSKLKAYIRARSGFNTSDGVTEILSDHLRQLCDVAITNANADSRKTVLDRDFKWLVKSKL